MRGLWRLLRVMHAIGLTNLSDEQVNLYCILMKEKMSVDIKVEPKNYAGPIAVLIEGMIGTCLPTYKATITDE
jgi:hypothetical protein